MYQHILVPLDGSPVAEQALPYALRLLRLSGGALTLARVAPSAVTPPPLYSMSEPETWLLRQAQMRQEAEDYLAEVAARPDVAAANPRALALAGLVGESLLNLIAQEKMDVLVMTMRRRRKLARWVLGSVADYLVQHAPIPVLLIHQGET